MPKLAATVGRDPEVRSLTKALDVLTAMGRRRQEMGVTELAAELDLPKSAIHRMLKTLETAGFVDRNPATRRYFLGARLFVLGKVYESTVTLKGLAHPILERLATQQGEAVHLVVPARAEPGLPSLILLDQIESNYRLTMTPALGSTTPAHCTAGGKVMLAFGDPTVLEKLEGPLPRLTIHTITDVAGLRAELAQIRTVGYAMDREELEIGLTCVAAPLFEANQVVGAISVSGPTSRMTPDRFPTLQQAVITVAREITERLR